MKSAYSSISHVCLVLLLSCAVCQARDWRSPDASVGVSLQLANSVTGSLDQLLIGGYPAKVLSHSPIRRENHGYEWMNSVSPTWTGNRFMVFEDEMGLCVVDAREKILLLNQVFTGYTRSPKSQTWVAIRYRPTSRKQEQLTGSEKDSIWFIDPENLAANAEQSTAENPFAHVAALELNGIAVARPFWSEDGNSVAIVKLLEGRLVADLFDPNRRVLIQSVPLPDLKLTEEQLLSVWIIPEVERSTAEAVRASHVFDLAKGKAVPADDKQSRLPTSGAADSAKPGARLTRSTSGEEYASPTPWRLIVALVVAALGLLWVLLKRRK